MRKAQKRNKVDGATSCVKVNDYRHFWTKKWHTAWCSTKHITAYASFLSHQFGQFDPRHIVANFDQLNLDNLNQFITSRKVSQKPCPIESWACKRIRKLLVRRYLKEKMWIIQIVVPVVPLAVIWGWNELKTFSVTVSHRVNFTMYSFKKK